jgi:hypothetical protein
MADNPEQKGSLEQAIGEMTMAWNHCQAAVFALFSLLLGAQLSKAQSVFFSINSDRGQRRAMQALLDFADVDFAKRAKKAIERFNDLGSDRNGLIHAIWDFPEGSQIATAWRGSWKGMIGKDPIAESARLMGDLEKLRGDLNALEEELRTNAPPAQGAFTLERLAMPSRQGAAQTATQADTARQQPASQSLPSQQQSSSQ